MNRIKPTSHYVDTGYIRIHYLDWGGDGYPLVLLHGLTSCAHTWNLTVPHLASQFRAYALDLRGHGESDKPDHGYDPTTVAEDVAGLLRAEGIVRATVVGHSWGCGIALHLAAGYPDLVSHLAMVEGGIGRPRSASRPATREEWDSRLAPLEIYASKETYLQAASGESVGYITPELEQIWMASVHVKPDGSVAEKLSREHQVLILQGTFERDSQQTLSNLRCPTLMVLARSSNPAAAERNAARESRIAHALEVLPSARALWMEDGVHDLQLQRPGELAEAISSFVRETA